MKRNFTIILLFLSLFSSSVMASVSESAVIMSDDEIHRDSIGVYSIVDFAIFYKQDEIEIDRSFQNNNYQIEQIKRFIQNAQNIESITIHSLSSPDGGYRYNRWLAHRRAENSRNLVDSILAEADVVPEKGVVIDTSSYENWPGLTKIVEEKYDRFDRDRVLSILNDQSIDNGARKWRLILLNGGTSWRYMLDQYMNSLRTTSFVCVKIREDVPAVKRLAAMQPGATSVSDTLSILPVADNVMAQNYNPKKEIFYLRTNLLAPLSNVGMEFCIGNHWSIGADYYFPWLHRIPDHKNCFQLLGLGLETRYWFGRNRTEEDRLEGHSIGASASVGYYDFERNFTGKQGEFIQVGVDYLYSLPVCKDKLHLEFTVGLGYIYSYLRPYDVFEEGGKAYKRGYTERFNWLGPTKLGVSLVVPIKCKRRGER